MAVIQQDSYTSALVMQRNSESFPHFYYGTFSYWQYITIL